MIEAVHVKRIMDSRQYRLSKLITAVGIAERCLGQH